MPDEIKKRGRPSLSEEEREAFDRQAAEQGDLKAFADSIREKGVKKAEEDIKKAESDEKKKADSTIEAPKANASKLEEPKQSATKK